MQFMGRTGIGGKSLVANWKKYGLLKPGAGNGNNGSRAGWNPKDVVGLDIGLSNPLQYFEQIMVPHLQKAGVNLSDPKQVMIAAQGLFGRQTGQRIASTFFDPKQRARIHADMALYDKASGVDKAYSQALYSDPRMAQMAAASSLKNMETMLGKSVFMSPAFTKAIVTMATGFNRLAGAFDQHPGFAKGVLALMGLGALAATLKVVGIGLRFILSPLKGLFALLFTVGPRNIGIVGWLLRGIAKGAPLLLRGVMALGGVLMEGLVALAPMVMEGIAGAFALLSNPVGWAIMAVIAVAAIWRFRHEIANIWTTKVVPWFKSAWTGLKSWLMGINWKAVGLFIADALTFGLASKFVGAMSKIKAAIASTPPSAAARAGNVGMNSHVGGLVGMRANGGPVLRGGRYLVGERGPEVVEFGANGRVIPNHHIAAMAGGPRHYRPGRSGGIGDVTININGARDPHETAREVRRELSRLANGQAALLSD